MQKIIKMKMLQSKTLDTCQSIELPAAHKNILLRLSLAIEPLAYPLGFIALIYSILH